MWTHSQPALTHHDNNALSLKIGGNLLGGLVRLPGLEDHDPAAFGFRFSR